MMIYLQWRNKLKNIVKDLFENEEIEIQNGDIFWVDNLCDQLKDWYSGTNSANNVYNIDYFTDYNIILSDSTADIRINATGDDGEYVLSIILSATISDDFTSILNKGYDVEREDRLEDEDD